MAKFLLDPKKHSNFGFNGCSSCDAKCCGSNIIYASIYDLHYASKYFPVLFYVYEKKISPVYFFYYGEEQNQKCPYLKGTMCGIYEERPYACRSYPFSFEQGQPCFDDGCPNVAPLVSGGMMIYDKNKNFSPLIKQEFIGEDFTKRKDMIFERTEEYVKFCIQNNFLVPFKDFYASSPLYLDFKKTLCDNLYILHPQRIAVLKMQNKSLFEGHEDFLLYTQQMISSYKNIEVLKSKCSCG